MAIAASVILLVLAILAYARHLRQAGWLLALRLLVVLLLAAILLDLVLDREWTRRSNTAVLLLDRSLSMTVAGADSVGRSVADRLQLPAGVRRRDWVFGDSARPTGDGSSVPDSLFAGRTRLAAALKTVSRVRPGAVVVVSDGQDNGEEDPVGLARSAGVPVYTIGCGRSAGPNLAITDLAVPDDVYAGETVLVAVRVSATGGRDPVGARSAARLGGASRELSFAPGGGDLDVEFRTAFPSAGVRPVRVAVDSLPGESDLSDNVRETAVRVRPGRVRVRYVTNRPGPGTRLLGTALRADPRVELGAAATLVGPVSAGESLAGIDVLVIDGMDEPAANGDALRRLVEHVEQGAGALVIAGPDFRAGPLLQRLLGLAAAPAAGAGSYAPALGPGGRFLNALAGIDFGRLRPFDRFFRATPPAGADVWLADSASGAALVWARAAGRGRVVFVAGEPLWRWGFADQRAGDAPEPETSSPLEVMLGVVLRYLTEAPARQFELSADRASYYSSQPVRLSLRARVPDGGPWSGLDVRMALDSGAADIPMTEVRDGSYEGRLSALGPGERRVAATVRLGDSILGSAGTEFAVLQQQLEYARTGLNRDLLVRLAEAGGGRYYEADSVPANGIELATAPARYRLRFQPRRSPWTYAVLVLLFGLELVLRRRKGLM